MMFEPLTFYLISKFEYETFKDNYFADMLRLSALVWVDGKEHDKVPRYLDWMQLEKQREVKRVEHTVSDVVDMFRGKGLLVD